MCLDTVGRFFMQKINKYIGSWDIRRVAPNIKVQNFFSEAENGIEMCPSL